MSTSTSTPKNLPPVPSNRFIFKTCMGLFISFVIVISILFALMYRVSIPTLMQNQVESRTEAITKLLAASILSPFSVKDYLSVNKITEATAKLPDIGYVTIINANDMAIAWAFGNISNFDDEFVNNVNKNGFPKQILTQIRLAKDVTFHKYALQVDGHNITEYAMRLNDVSAEVHVGLLTNEVLKTIDVILLPYGLLLLITIILASIMIFWVSRLISISIK